MTMAEIWKACTLHESSSSPPSKMGPQMVGFLSVLAISGSVALISLVSKAKPRQGVGEEEPKNNTHPQGGGQLEEEYYSHSDSDSSSEENEHAQRSFHEDKNVAPLKRKKVRFAPDVIEPPCNGQQYRSRWKVSQGREVMRTRLPADTQAAPKSPSIPANRLALYKGLRQSRLQHSLHCS
eukprot:c29731_g1_i1 orf=54-593(-)